MNIERILHPRDDSDMIAIIGENFLIECRGLGSYDHSHFMMALEALISSGTGAAWKMLSNDQLVGMLVASIHVDMASGKVIALEQFCYVLQGCRGCGNKLYDVFEQWADDIHCDLVSAGHPYASNRMEKFLEHRGYKPLEVVYVRNAKTEALCHK